jgi:hypothetical protein
VTRGRRGAGQWRHTPRTSCSTRAASTASAPRVCVLARPGSGQSPLGPPGPRRCGQWAVDALSSSLRGAWGAPSCGLGRTQPRNSPIAKSFRLCTSSSPSALPLAQGGGGPGPRLRAALFRGPGSCIYMHISLATLSTEAQAPETCLPNHCF